MVETQIKISNIITDQISPLCIEFVHQHAKLIKNIQIVYNNVKFNSKNIYYIKKYRLSENGCYVRDGSLCRGLLPDEIKKRYSKTLNIIKPPIEEVTSLNQRLTFITLKLSLVKKRVSYDNNSFAKKFKLLDKDGKYNEMVYLLFDQFDELIKVCRFKK